MPSPDDSVAPTSTTVKERFLKKWYFINPQTSEGNKHLIYKSRPRYCGESHWGLLARPLNSTLCNPPRPNLASQQMGGGLWSVEAILCMAAVACPGVTSPAASRAVPWPSHWAGVQLSGWENADTHLQPPPPPTHTHKHTHAHTHSTLAIPGEKQKV